MIIDYGEWMNDDDDDDVDSYSMDLIMWRKKLNNQYEWPEWFVKLL